jgi:hypothetical protein
MPAANYPPPAGPDAPFLEWAARSHLATDLAARVRPKVVGAPDGWHPESFLEAVVAAKTSRG